MHALKSIWSFYPVGIFVRPGFDALTNKYLIIHSRAVLDTGTQISLNRFHLMRHFLMLLLDKLRIRFGHYYCRRNKKSH